MLANLGVVGIISTSTVPRISIQRPLLKNQATQMMREDVQAGAWPIISHITEALQPILGWGNSEAIALLTVAPAVIPASLVGQTFGAVKGVTVASFEKADEPLTQLAGEADLQESLRNRVLEQVRGITSHPVVLVKKPFPKDNEKEFSRMSCVMSGTLAWVPPGQTPQYYLISDGIDTALEIQLIYPALKAEQIINPAMAFDTEVRARLTKVRDGKEIYSCSIKYQSEKRKFVEWSSKNAQPLRDELDRFCQYATSEIVERLSVRSWPSNNPMELAGVITK
jgi:hypothetical protein